ncbi:hypothetical protein QE357_000925 [Siphonobacter sp. BAB-5404]|nr:hypothetical protein [Siphonobacter sp. SORGH_AS_0500]
MWTTRMIRLGYRKVINAASDKAWDRQVFEDTHREFFMQAQFYDQQGKYQTFAELVTHIPQADRLHSLVSTAAVGYIRQLKGLIPDVSNAYGKRCLPFQNFRFEIIHSHMQRKEEHAVAIYFYTEPLTWIDTVGPNLLIAYEDSREALRKGEEVETDLIPLQPFLTIHSIEAHEC